MDKACDDHFNHRHGDQTLVFLRQAQPDTTLRSKDIYALTGSRWPTQVKRFVTYSGFVNEALPDGFPPVT
jgi:hypothetical protein